MPVKNIIYSYRWSCTKDKTKVLRKYPSTKFFQAGTKIILNSRLDLNKLV